MGETVLDVLMYLFENFSEQESEPDQMVLREELLHAGFAEMQVDRALDWLEELTDSDGRPFANQPLNRSTRLYSSHELTRLDAGCRGYIHYLEQVGILTAMQRELVIDRVMALDSADIDVDQVKWVVLMVLFSQPGEADAFSRMEDLVFDDNDGAVH